MKMNKLFRVVVVFVLLGGLIYGFYSLFMRPVGFISQVDVVQSYLSQLDESTCETHFIEETQEVCTQFITSFDGVSFVIVETVAHTGYVDVTLEYNDVQTVFTFYIETEEPSGLRGILTKEYYKIDHIE